MARLSGPRPEPASPEEGSDADRRWMDRALVLALEGWGRVHPNPLVGAVVVNGDRAVGEGHHAEFGGPHAEVLALREAGEDARGGTLYVNLEPCRHSGKTPPCTGAVLDAGIRRVVVGCLDPHDRAGGGAAELQEEGVEVTVGVRAATARRLNARFLWRQVADRPYVQLKYALSVDGYLSREVGRRSRVTGEEAGAYVHWLRAGFGAILVGRRTVQADDPLLTVRGEVTPREPPARVVLDPELRTSLDSRLVGTADRVPLWIVGGPDAPANRRKALESRGVRVLSAERSGPHRLDPESVLASLARQGTDAVLVEGGGRVGSSFLRADVVDRMALLRAPILYGDGGVPAFPGEMPSGRGRWTPSEGRTLGEDLLWVLERSRAADLLARSVS